MTKLNDLKLAKRMKKEKEEVIVSDVDFFLPNGRETGFHTPVYSKDELKIGGNDDYKIIIHSDIHVSIAYKNEPVQHFYGIPFKAKTTIRK